MEYYLATKTLRPIFFKIKSYLIANISNEKINETSKI